EGLRLDDWRKVLGDVRRAPGVDAAAPFVLTQGLISAGHDYGEGVIVYGVDPDTGRRAVTSFARHFTRGHLTFRPTHPAVEGGARHRRDRARGPARRSGAGAALRRRARGAARLPLPRARLAVAERLAVLGPEARETRDGVRGVPDLRGGGVQRGRHAHHGGPRQDAGDRHPARDGAPAGLDPPDLPGAGYPGRAHRDGARRDRKSTRLNSSH